MIRHTSGLLFNEHLLDASCTWTNKIIEDGASLAVICLGPLGAIPLGAIHIA